MNLQSKTMSKKKKVKAKQKVKAIRRQQGVMAIIPYSEIVKPEVYKGKYSIIPTPFNERQLLQMITSTPKDVILQRKGKGGKMWDYIPTWWFKKKLNFAFGWMWDFDILDQRIDGDFITVKGKLTVKNSKGEVMINKTDFGGHQVTYQKDKPHKPENYLDISNDFKAAASDCLKRCSVHLGFGLDVYSKSESVGEGYQVKENGDNPVKPTTQYQPRPTPQYQPKQTTKPETPAKPLISDLIRLKDKLFKLGAKTPAQAINKYNDITGENIKSLAVSPARAKEMLFALLNSPSKK